MSVEGKKKVEIIDENSHMMSGADILVQALVNNGVSTIFAYPGGQSIPLHQALIRYRDQLRVVLPRHEQGGGFAAQGYARSTGKIGVCMTTSGPGATNLITSIADAKLDSVPILAITGQVSTKLIGSDGFQETPMTEVCRSITKHHYLVQDIKDLARIVNEAIYVATTGRPGPVLIDVPKDVQVDQCYPNFHEPMNLPGYVGETLKATDQEIATMADAIIRAKRPVFFSGGGVVSANATKELRKIAELVGIPVVTSMTGLSSFPRDHQLCLGMMGMHGTCYANHTVQNADLMIACGVRFSDRVTGKVSEFAKFARVIQIDIDPSEINKVKSINMSIIADLKDTLARVYEYLKNMKFNDMTVWHEQIRGWKEKFPVGYDESPYPSRLDLILTQYAIETLSKRTQNTDTIICTGVGQHQLWTTLFYHFQKPRTWLSSCGSGTMGFGLPAAMGAKLARPEATVIDIDGDGSFQMNIQEMATCYTEKIPVKVMLINNQHLGNVVQWEDMFQNGNRAHTYLGPIDDPETFGKGNGISPAHRYPDYVEIARGYGWEALSVAHKSDFPAALEQMLQSDRPFLLDVAVPYREHVLPIIPPGETVNETILHDTRVWKME